MEIDTHASNSRNSSRKEKGTGVRDSCVSLRDTNTPNLLDSGVASLDTETSSTRSLLGLSEQGVTNMRQCNGRLQRTPKIDEVDCASIMVPLVKTSDGSPVLTRTCSPGTPMLPSIPSMSPPPDSSSHQVPDLLNTPIPDLFGGVSLGNHNRFPTPSPSASPNPGDTLDSLESPKTTIGHSNVPGLQPVTTSINNNKCHMQTSGWL